jgi:hypothetical protein
LIRVLQEVIRKPRDQVIACNADRLLPVSGVVRNNDNNIALYTSNSVWQVISTDSCNFKQSRAQVQMKKWNIWLNNKAGIL